ncbi:MAG TPA: AzlC family ABC transporter permease [Nocardioides sp.]|nr:AzlC family ABC transporter permease [Nocardioides sp.]
MTRASLLTGMRLGLGPGAATFILGISFGATAVTAGWGLLLPVVSSMFTFSGSAQFTLVTTLPTGTAVAAVAGAVLINVRYLVMGIALNDSLRGGRLRRGAQAQALVDASFVVAHDGAGRFDVGRLVGMTAVQWACWVGGTALGVWLRPAPDLLRSLGADVVFPAFFLLLALDEMRSLRPVVAVVAGATLSGLLIMVVDPGFALLAATAGAVIAALPGPRVDLDTAGRRR